MKPCPRKIASALSARGACACIRSTAGAGGRRAGEREGARRRAAPRTEKRPRVVARPRRGSAGGPRSEIEKKASARRRPGWAADGRGRVWGRPGVAPSLGGLDPAREDALELVAAHAADLRRPRELRLDE